MYAKFSFHKWLKIIPHSSLFVWVLSEKWRHSRASLFLLEYNPQSQKRHQLLSFTRSLKYVWSQFVSSILCAKSYVDKEKCQQWRQLKSTKSPLTNQNKWKYCNWPITTQGKHANQFSNKEHLHRFPCNSSFKNLKVHEDFIQIEDILYPHRLASYNILKVWGEIWF